MNTFNAGSCITFGWETFKKRPVTLIVAVVITASLNILIIKVVNDLIPSPEAKGLFAVLVNAIALALLASFFLKAHDAIENLKIVDLLHPRFIAGGVTLSVIYEIISYALSLIAFVFSYAAADFSQTNGTAVLIIFIPIAFLFLLIQIMFTFPILVSLDKGFGPFRAVWKGFHLMRGHRLSLLGLFILCGILALEGAVVLIGVFIAIPVIALAVTHAYRTLEHQSDEITLSPVA